MAHLITTFSDEQARCVVNLAQQYDAWIEVERAQAALPYNLVRKEVSGHSYLYELLDRDGNGKSLGPFDGEAEEKLAAYLERKSGLKERRKSTLEALDVTARLYRALRLPQID